MFTLRDQNYPDFVCIIALLFEQVKRTFVKESGLCTMYIAIEEVAAARAPPFEGREKRCTKKTCLLAARCPCISIVVCAHYFLSAAKVLRQWTLYRPPSSPHLVATCRPRSMSDDAERGIGDGEESELPTATKPPATAMAANLQPSVWEPDQDLMSTLLEMGINAVAAKKALFHTGNSSAEVAVAWIYDNTDVDLDTPLEVEANREALALANRERSGGSRGHSQEIYKMVFVVNAGLQMGVGKTAAQVAHAALGIHQILLQSESKFGEPLLKW